MRHSSAVIAASVLMVCGCTAMHRQVATDSGAILAEAGFHKIDLETTGEDDIPLRQIGKRGPEYSFADPEFCKCRYSGGGKELKTLNDLRAARVLAHEWSMRAIGIISAGADENGWGPWKPEGLDVR